MVQPAAYGNQAQAPYPGAPSAPAASPSPGQEVLARLPLQIGTTSAWSAGRSAAALFPGFALVAVAVSMLRHLGSYDGRFTIAVAAVGVMLVIYAGGHLLAAVRTRASDVLLYGDGLSVDGGRLHGEKIAWGELTAPYAEMEDTTANRITLGSMFWVALMIVARSNSVSGGATSKVQVWRLYLHQKGTRRLIAETDRPIERDSMAAAASSVSAVVNGQRYVAEAPTMPTRMLTCPGCGAAAVPDDAPAVTCIYCGTQIALPNEIRGQAAASKAMSQSRGTTTDIIAKLREQPRAAHTNAGLLVLSAVMFGAWPLGWGLVAFRVFEDGFQATDLFCLLLPFAAVIAGFFVARGRLADRGALQLLTLGFGALSPARQGQPSRCRRCQGPLPDAGIGGVTQCRYCAAENIVGLDLRPTVDPARAEQSTFDDALKKRASEKRLWASLTGLAVVLLLGWVVGTVIYVAHLTEKAKLAGATQGGSHESARPAPKQAPAARPGKRK
jgi:hypothetical protein